MKGQRVLEFGCNYGATAIVLSHLGMDVVAVDTEESLIAAARLNSRRYGAEHINFLRVSEGEPLPFNDSDFDLITCNSVLEYVDPNVLAQRLRDFDRLLRPGGTLLVMGTSNRLAFREIHSRRYFVNYLPPSFDRFIGSVKPFQRGVWPWTIRSRFPDYQDLVLADWGSGIVSAKRAKNIGPARIVLLHMLRFVCGAFAISVGSILPNIFMALRKPGPDLKKVNRSDRESSNLIHQTKK
jgi:ubiquinone/menaquinone biosynthesis C-methylase UbiE